MLELLLEAIYWWLVLILAIILAGAWKGLWTLREYRKRGET